jgi:hypothetical protein
MSGLISEEFARKLIGMGWKLSGGWPLGETWVVFSRGMLNYIITPNWHSLAVGYDDDISVWKYTSSTFGHGLTAEDHYRALIAKFKSGIDAGERETIGDLENQIAMVKSWTKEAREFILSQEDGEQ